MKLGLIGIVGEEYKSDFWGTLGMLAEAGYQGIEAITDHLLEGDVAENMARMREIGLDHITVGCSREDLRERLDELSDKAEKTGATRISMWWSEANNKELLLQEAELYNSAGKVLKERGFKLCYHNHHHEFWNVFDGSYALDILVQNTDPESVYFNIDIGWVSVGGEDPAKVLRRLKGRVPTIHVKDFYDLKNTESFTTVGTGQVILEPALLAAEESGVEWAVVEQDRLRHLSGMETAMAAGLHLRERGVGSTR